MKKQITFLFLFCTLMSIGVYSQNALDFDGIDDQVNVANASSLINTGSGISLGMWVYPRNAAPNFPNFDGFGGFRNDSDADFYLVQIGANTVEARFRNSIGANADIVFSGLVLNAWQHLVFTYDGTNIKLYHNGLEVGSQAANGSITNSSQSLYIGNIVYSINDFLLDGKIDEVVLYNKALSGAEINCLQHGDVDTSDVSLKLYYGCNQGVAGGLNTSINTLSNYDAMNGGTLNGFALDGNSSNFIIGDIFAATEIATICSGESYTYDGTVYTSAGTYSFYFPLGNGCDSVSHFVLHVNSVDTSLNANNTILTSTGIASAYQWVQCDNNYAQITGATQSSYTVTSNGDYAVIITNGNCVDTSRCVTVVVTGFENKSTNNDLIVWPNPAYETINLSVLDTGYNLFTIFDETGRVILTTTFTSNTNNKIIHISALEAGIYFISGMNDSGKIVKSRFVIMR
ncbi:MAG TPA: T9SS type A sorting domain-containing protein [Bacteroidia bacterium]|nr:T9SS type A sorting domain-containing protein [Bacteroidia bacterium]